MATIRLQKVLARAGVASRRAAEGLIAAGRVRVDGHVITQMGTKVESRGSRVEVDGTRIVREEPIYIVLHKPRGVVSTMNDPEGRPSVRELLVEAHARVFPVGRLDFNTSGVLLATNDGEFTDALLHPRRIVPKTYIVKVQGVMTPDDVDAWRRGVDLEDGKTQPAKVKLLRHEGDKTWLELTITEGRNQQVRRMGDATRFRVMRLARTSFAGITSEALAPGRWRYLTGDELKDLKKEYGVPKRVVASPAPPKSAERRAPFRTTPSRPGGAGREERERGDGRDRGRAPGREAARGRETGRGREAGRGRAPTEMPGRGREPRAMPTGREAGRGREPGAIPGRGREAGRGREPRAMPGRGRELGREAGRGREPRAMGRGREAGRGREPGGMARGREPGRDREPRPERPNGTTGSRTGARERSGPRGDDHRGEPARPPGRGGPPRTPARPPGRGGPPRTPPTGARIGDERRPPGEARSGGGRRPGKPRRKPGRKSGGGDR